MITGELSGFENQRVNLRRGVFDYDTHQNSEILLASEPRKQMGIGLQFKQRHSVQTDLKAKVSFVTANFVFFSQKL